MDALAQSRFSPDGLRWVPGAPPAASPSAAPAVSPTLAAVQACQHSLLSCGFVCLTWTALAEGLAAPNPFPPENTSGVLASRPRGWQHLAAAAVEAEALNRLRPLLPAPVQARFRSQGDPGASMWLNVFPVDERSPCRRYRFCWLFAAGCP